MEILNIRRELFWDVDPDRLNEETNRRLIIERVFSYGTVDELADLVTFYGLAVIRDEIKRAGSLDKKTFEFASTLLEIPKQSFKCYIEKPSVRTP
jgi:hypothetical protein